MKRYFVRLTSIAAMAVLTACHSLTPGDQQIFDQGMDAINAGDWIDADRLLDEVIEKNQSYSPAYLSRGRARFELGRHSEALDDLERALEANDLLESETIEAMLFKGRSFVEIGRRQFDLVPDDESSEAFRHL